MWSSIKKIIIPASFEEAINKKTNSAVFYGGGTYLVSNKDEKIDTLIDINSLIDKSIKVDKNSLTIGSGVAVQEIANDEEMFNKLSMAAKYSNFSKNIRNQRTIGGEIAQKNIRSDLFTFLVALNPLLEIRNPAKIMIKLREWNGKGIINKILISITDLKSSGFERYSVLESAPAFLIVAVVRKALELDFVISGKADKIYGHTMQLSEFSKNSIHSIIDNSAKHFSNDQYGSVEYKASLIATGIKRAVEQI